MEILNNEDIYFEIHLHVLHKRICDIFNIQLHFCIVPYKSCIQTIISWIPFRPPSQINNSDQNLTKI
jgi:hypothetical protein